MSEQRTTIPVSGPLVALAIVVLLLIFAGLGFAIGKAGAPSNAEGETARASAYRASFAAASTKARPVAYRQAYAAAVPSGRRAGRRAGRRKARRSKAGGVSASTSAAAPPPALSSYSTSAYGAQVPAAWTLESDDAQHDTYRESVWRDPADANTSITIDYTLGDTTSAQASAESVRAATSRTAGYREISFAPTSISGKQGIKWIFEVDGDRRVDYFFNDCATGYAMLGSTSPASFSARESTFRAVVESISARCGGD